MSKPGGETGRTRSRTKPAKNDGRPGSPRPPSAPSDQGGPMSEDGQAPRIVVFSCQWAPHYALQSLYRRGLRGEGAGVRLLSACIGRVGEDLVLEAFRQGADGVAVVGCPPELCRHGLDHERFQARLRSLRAILETLGVPPERLLAATCRPHEGASIADSLHTFIDGVRLTVKAGQ
jgi:coenzyme F420-reducing hydrogenase delta subunit